MNASSLSRTGICAVSIALAVATGCAGDSFKSAETTTPASRAQGLRLDLGLRLSDGSWLELGDLRGTPVLLFVFATFDMVSQASLTALRPFVQQHPEVLVVGVASEPRATQLVEAWAYALDPPFVVGANPYGQVENARSVLGKIKIVPTYILYDSEGYELERVTGYQSEAQLDTMVKPLTRRR
ncbi:MAG: hypothetical protein O7F08_03055 [Deltaproteobacteria bacterium]|nr:hypothetical protein [Deltaproteobacteria bacterium]